MPKTIHPPLHPAAAMYLTELKHGKLSRREFLTRATGLGVSSALALSMAGAPARAQTPTPAQGGTVRIQQRVNPLKDPRLFDWSELANLTRGFLEYLVEYNPDGSFHGMLLESWDVNEDATRYVLNIREGVLWNNGDPFTTQDVLRNIAGWCDTTLDGNSMTSRMSALIDPATGQLRDGAAKALNDTQIELNLSAPDITLIASFADYPAAITHQSYDGGDPFTHGIGTGPFRPLEIQIGSHCVLERNTEHSWWGTPIYGGPYLDRIEFKDLGTDPVNWAKAAWDNQIDLLYQTVGDFIDVMTAQGWTPTFVDSASTLVIRTNQKAEIDGKTPYADVRLRQALQMGVDNAICLELGYANHGVVAANHHVGPLHPAYADIGPALYDPQKALKTVTELGLTDFVHELVTIDDEWQRNTGDTVAALLNDAGLIVRRKLVSGPDFWVNWKNYPFSATEWNHRPLDVQVLALAYRSNAIWNETGFSNPDFDAALDTAMSLADADQRRASVEKMETILREEGVIIQPFWRRLFNHHNGKLIGADKHPSNEIHLYKLGFKS